MLTLIHGPAELLRAEALVRVRGRALPEDTALAELNTITLDGRHITLADLEFACEVIPFLAERRLVIVTGLFKRLSSTQARRSKAAALQAASIERSASDLDAEAGDTGATGNSQGAALLDYLARVPETTELVLIEEETLTGGTSLRRVAELERKGRAAIVACANLRGGELQNWVRERARRHHIQLDPAALSDIVEFAGDDLRQLDQELMKLRDFGASRAQGDSITTITRADVRQLVPATRAANVFEMVEALGSGNGQAAARLLYHALEVDGEEPLRLLALITWQYRQILQAKAMQIQQATPADVARQLNVPDWKVNKLLAQASRHSLGRLVQMMEQMVVMDEAIKTGKLSDREAMDVLLAQLTAPITTR